MHGVVSLPNKVFDTINFTFNKKNIVAYNCATIEQLWHKNTRCLVSVYKYNCMFISHRKSKN